MGLIARGSNNRPLSALFQHGQPKVVRQLPLTDFLIFNLALFYPVSLYHLHHPTPPIPSLTKMTVDSVEIRKMQYARELAAYTMRQWNIMREAVERERSLAASTVQHTQNLRPRSRSQPQDGTGICLLFLPPPASHLILFQQHSALLPTLSLSIAFAFNKPQVNGP